MKKIIILILLFIIGIGAYLYSSYNSFLNTEIVKENMIIKINSGDTFYTLPDYFDINHYFFRAYMKISPPYFMLQAGKYEIKAGSNINKIIDSLQKPIIEGINITILEGWNIYDIDHYLSKKGLTGSGEFLEAHEKDLGLFEMEYPQIFGRGNIKTLEGFLYPDTYNIDPNNFNLRHFIIKMIENFKTKVYDPLLSNKSPEEILKIINLASIVEKEERNPKERPVVAGILEKRLNENWFIGADATVCYPYKLIHSECTPEFIINHIQDKNKYNTRNMLGLPDTPICSPSYSAVEAVENSEDSSYYYYLHDSDGGIHYAETNAEHVRNKKMWLD